MIRVLAMIAVAGFLLSAACLGAAVAITGPEFIMNGAWSWNGDHWGNQSWRSHKGFGLNHDFDHDGPKATREAGWNSDELQVNVPANVRFTQASGPAKLVIHGPQSILDHLVIEDGKISFDRGNYSGPKIDVELTAPKVTRFALNGSGHIEIGDYKQSELDLRINGDGDVAAQGSADTVRLDISGSGEADLSALANDATEVTISGSGRAKIRPKTSARLTISGSGDVDLLSKPKRVESHVSGSGNIEQNDDVTADEPAPPAPPAKPAKAGKAAKAV